MIIAGIGMVGAITEGFYWQSKFRAIGIDIGENMRDYLNDDVAFLHDCEVSEIIYEGKNICFVTSIKEQECLSSVKNKKVKIQFILSSDFIDESFIPAVQIISWYRWKNKGIARLTTLKNFVDFIHRKRYKFIFYECYFNHDKCLIIGEFGTGRKSLEAHIELLMEDIVCETIDNFSLQ